MIVEREEERKGRKDELRVRQMAWKAGDDGRRSEEGT
jgi:hypothetical protein